MRVVVPAGTNSGGVVIPGESSFLTGDALFGGRGPHTQYTYTKPSTSLHKHTQHNKHTHSLFRLTLLPIEDRTPPSNDNQHTTTAHSHAARKINRGAQWRAKWPLRSEQSFLPRIVLLAPPKMSDLDHPSFVRPAAVAAPSTINEEEDRPNQRMRNPEATVSPTISKQQSRSMDSFLPTATTAQAVPRSGAASAAAAAIGATSGLYEPRHPLAAAAFSWNPPPNDEESPRPNLERSFGNQVRCHTELSRKHTLQCLWKEYGPRYEQWKHHQARLAVHQEAMRRLEAECARLLSDFGSLDQPLHLAAWKQEDTDPKPNGPARPPAQDPQAQRPVRWNKTEDPQDDLAPQPLAETERLSHQTAAVPKREPAVHSPPRLKTELVPPEALAPPQDDNKAVAVGASLDDELVFDDSDQVALFQQAVQNQVKQEETPSFQEQPVQANNGPPPDKTLPAAVPVSTVQQQDEPHQEQQQQEEQEDGEDDLVEPTQRQEASQPALATEQTSIQTAILRKIYQPRGSANDNKSVPYQGPATSVAAKTMADSVPPDQSSRATPAEPEPPSWSHRGSQDTTSVPPPRVGPTTTAVQTTTADSVPPDQARSPPAPQEPPSPSNPSGTTVHRGTGKAVPPSNDGQGDALTLQTRGTKADAVPPCWTEKSRSAPDDSNQPPSLCNRSETRGKGATVQDLPSSKDSSCDTALAMQRPCSTNSGSTSNAARDGPSTKAVSVPKRSAQNRVNSSGRRPSCENALDLPSSKDSCDTALAMQRPSPTNSGSAPNAARDGPSTKAVSVPKRSAQNRVNSSGRRPRSKLLARITKPPVKRKKDDAADDTSLSLRIPKKKKKTVATSNTALLSNMPGITIKSKETRPLPGRPKAPENRQDSGKKPSVCRFFASGKCRHGAKCRYLHETSAPPLVCPPTSNPSRVHEPRGGRPAASIQSDPHACSSRRPFRSERLYGE